MKTTKITKKIMISATAAEVWKAITSKETVKKYFFGTNVESDWKEGSSITYSGNWEGKEYKDKGDIIKVEKNKLLQHTHWSSLSGKPDTPENYYTITYELKEKDHHTEVSVTQEGQMSENAAQHSGKNWEMVLEKLKEVTENEFHHAHSSL